MKLAFLIGFLLLCIASAFMWESQPAGASGGKVPLVWTSDDNPLRKEQIADFNARHPALSLTLDPVNQGIDKVIVQALAGVGPDLLDCRDANQLAAYVKSGIALDVTEELRSRGIDVASQTWPCMHSMAILEGRVYGVPTNAAANAIWINKDAFRESGVPIPTGQWTWDQFVVIAQRLTKRDEAGKPIRFGFLMDWWNFQHFLYSFGGRIFSSDGTRCTLDTPEAVGALALMHDLVYKYKVTPSPVQEAGMASTGGWGSGTINLFGAKRGAMALGGRWWLANMRTMSGLNLTVAESPYSGVPGGSSAGRATLINAKSPRKEQALEFLTYLASKEYGELVNNQADGIAAFKSQCQGPAFEHNPSHPEEDYNPIWRDVTPHAVGTEASPYVNGQVFSKIIEKQVDLVKANAKSPANAMRDAKRLIDEAIQARLADNPLLRSQWEAAVAKGGK